MILALQTAVAFFSVILAWSVLSLPWTKGYSLQVLALMLIVFVILKRFGRKKTFDYKQKMERKSLWQAIEIAPLGVAVLLLIGNTGGFSSWLLPLIFVYFFFLMFANRLPATILTFIVTIVFVYYFTPDFAANNYGAVLSLLIFLPIAVFAQKYYAQAIKESNELALEREKISYYNLYAEKQQNELIKREQSTQKALTLKEVVSELIPQVDALQKESRFPQNQLVVSAQLTKIGLKLRQALKNAGE